jgi:flagellar biosynthetic protein FlhB
VSEQGEKSFEATDQRREEFRKQGRYARAKDLGGLVATGAVVAGVYAARRQLVAGASTLFTRSLGDLSAVERLGASGALRAPVAPLLAEIAPLFVVAAVLALLASAAQVRFRINTDAIAVKFDRLDPKGGLDKLIAFKKNFGELIISLLRVAAVGGVAWRAVAGELPLLLSVARAPVIGSMETAGGAVGRVILAVLVALVIVAAVDYAFAWFSLEKELMMTRQERIEESRQSEGDQKAKGRMKARSRALSRKRAVASVKGADVIVTNPTHIAIALRYGPTDPAPVVLAKGTDDIALRMRAEARRFGIPILENKPLARALNAEVPVGRPVPAAHFASVAQVLAFVYRLKKRGVIGGTRRA